MTKRSCLFGMIFSGLVSIIMIYVINDSIGNGNWIAVIFAIILLAMMNAFLFFLSDYRYLNGMLSENQLKMTRHWEYWYFRYAHNAYYEYRKHYDFKGKYKDI